MYYLISVALGLVAVVMLALTATQFWRLGQYLKNQWPIAFRLYAAFWFLIGFVFVGLFSYIAYNKATPPEPSAYDRYLSSQANHAAAQAAIAAADAAQAASEASGY